MLGRTDARTRERMYCQAIRTVRDISRDDRAIIATCSLRTPTERLEENYSIDMTNVVDCYMGFRSILTRHNMKADFLDAVPFH